ncbi:hypothetical protein O6072_03225 [Mycolicibacterium neoaurum]|uniref:hypothetical protein n=1 Tax=Mycolicibacterium neoaurum TaxID=1795 RepID=UPI00248CE15F|nr:hypothetical protein [Mycolicibacterium neoaurum]WBP94793.1 hypothetical protein O7W24_00890 [Mycolicibacterium neoaurum]WBS08905.1 hypothetical protein O6072_03225 [Mycolicibacterium neoaurum]
MSEFGSRYDEIILERYKYINSQLAALNEAGHKFLALYQTLTTAIVSGGLALFVGYRGWGISADHAHAGLAGLLILQIIVAICTCAFIVAGIASWIDYRNEEVDLLTSYLDEALREAPKLQNFYRWYETYMILLIVTSTTAIVYLALSHLSPAMT